MNPKNRFKLTRQAMFLATISAAFPVTGYCAAGRVDFAFGNVESVTSTGSRHPLSKGAEINTGETISTAAGARAQVRFADGGFISLQPNTQFRVDEFNYKNKTDGEEKGFFSLLKGGFRAITGAIGHVNKNTYRVKTPAATLGIRGTGYNMALRDDGLFVNVGEGAISLSNKAGLLVVTAGGAAFVANANTAPVPTNEQPQTPPAGLQDPTFSVADNRDNSGNLTVLQGIPINLVSGTNYEMSYAYTGSSPAAGAVGGSVGIPAPVSATFNSTSQLLQYSNSGATETGTIGTGAVSFSATDGIIGWGRWTGTFTSTGQGATAATAGMTTFDYIVGIPTAVMPTTGTANYSLLGFTTPTDSLATPGYTLTGASLSVNFAATSNQVGVSFTVTNNTTRTYAVTGGATISGSSFTGTGTAPMNGQACTYGCTASINGFFAGANAARAGLAYTITDISNHVQGVAAFARP